SGDIVSISQECHNRRIPTILRDGVVLPLDICGRIGVKASRGQGVTGAKIGRVRHINRNLGPVGILVLGKNSVERVRRRYCLRLGRASSITQALVAAKIEELVPNNFSACGSTELIAVERRLGCWSTRIDVIEEVFRIEKVISKEIVS